jgi:hypothetical protein
VVAVQFRSMSLCEILVKPWAVRTVVVRKKSEDVVVGVEHSWPLMMMVGVQAAARSRLCQCSVITDHDVNEALDSDLE